MGYRSQVRSLIFGPEEQINAFLAMQSLVLGSKVLQDSDFMECLTRYPIEIEEYTDTGQDDGDGGTTWTTVKKTIHVLDLYGDNWKWYEGYEDVQAWNKLVAEAEEFGLDTEFLRIGEETEDIEHTSSSQNDWLLSVSRTINNEMTKGDDIPLGI